MNPQVLRSAREHYETQAQLADRQKLIDTIKDTIVWLELVGTYQSISKAVELRKVIGWGE